MEPSMRQRALRRKAGLPEDQWGDMMDLASSDAEGGVNEAQKKVALSRLGSLDLADTEDPEITSPVPSRAAVRTMQHAERNRAATEDPEITAPMESMAAARTRQHAERNRASREAMFNDDPELTAPNAIGPTLSQVQAMRHAHRNKTSRDAMFADDPALTPPVGPGIGPKSVRTMQHAERNRNAPDAEMDAARDGFYSRLHAPPPADPEMDAAKDGFYDRLRAPAPVDQEMVDAEAGFYDRLRNQPPVGGVADTQAMRERYRNSRVGGQSGGSEPAEPFTPGIAPNTPEGLDIGLDESLPSRPTQRVASRQKSDSPLIRGPLQVDMGRRASELVDAEAWDPFNGLRQARMGAALQKLRDTPRGSLPGDEPEVAHNAAEEAKEPPPSGAAAGMDAQIPAPPLLTPKGPDASAIASQNSRDVGQSMLDKVRNLRSRRDAAGDYRWIDRLGEDLYAAGTGKKPSYAAYDAMKSGLDDNIKNVGLDAASDAKVAASDPNSPESANARAFWRQNFKTTPIADTMSAADLMSMLPSMKQADATRKLDATVEDIASKIGDRTAKQGNAARIATLREKLANATTKKYATQADKIAADKQIATDRYELAKLEFEEKKRATGEMEKDRDAARALSASEGVANRTSREAMAKTAATAAVQRGVAQKAQMLGFKLADPKIAQTYQGLVEFASQFPDAMTGGIDAPKLSWLDEAASKFDITRGMLPEEKQRLVRMAENFQSLLRNDRTGAAASVAEDRNFALLMGRGISGDPKALSEAIRMFARAARNRYATMEGAAGLEAVHALHANDAGNMIPSADAPVFQHLGGSESEMGADAPATEPPVGAVGRTPDGNPARYLGNGEWEEIQ